MALTYNKFQDFVEQFSLGNHLFGTHTFKVMLSTVAPVATNSVKGDLTEISPGNGYAAGGATTTTAQSESGGTLTVTGTQVSWTASSGQIVFRYLTLYNDTTSSPNKPLVCWFDYGTTVTLNDTDTFTFKFNNASPGTIFTLT